MIWNCSKCGAKNDYQVHLAKDKNCEDCWTYLDFIDEKFIDEDSEFWRRIYKIFKIIDFAVSKWFRLDWIRAGLYNIKPKYKSLWNTICYKYFYLDLYKKKWWNNDADWKIGLWGWNDILMSKDFIYIIKTYLEENPTIETQALDFEYFDIYYADDRAKRLFELLNLK